VPFIAYQDNFNDPNSGWGIDSNDDLEIGYLSGEYRISPKKPNQPLAVLHPATSFSEFSFQVKARHDGAAVGGDYGLVFRREDRDNFYLFSVDPVNRAYVFVKRELGSWVSIIDRT